MSLWDSFFGRSNTPPPGMPGGPPRQLALPRLLNLLINPFAITQPQQQAGFGKAVYQYSNYGDPALLRDQLLNPFPVWIGVDLQLGAQKTARGHFPIPANFYLLALLASTSISDNGGFKFVLYDTYRRIQLMTRMANFNVMAGRGNSPLFLRVPYLLNPQGGEVKVKFTIASLEKRTTNVQLALYGTQVSDTMPPPTRAQRFAASLHP